MTGWHVMSGRHVIFHGLPVFFYPHNDEEPQPANPPGAPGSTAELCPIFGEASPRACGEWMTCDDWMTCDEWVACDDWMTCGEWLTRGE